MSEFYMTVEEVHTRVEAIREVAHDPEKAHAMEDALYVDVLRSMSEGIMGLHCYEIAQVALQTKTIEFARWCA